MFKRSRLSMFVVLIAMLALSVTTSASAYTQEFYNYDTGAGSRIRGMQVDWSGQYYILKRNASDTVSYIYQNYSPTNKTSPFITINATVKSFKVTSDKDASYVYYEIEGQNGLYRLPLVKGANHANADYKEFSFEGTGFLFSSFSLAEDPDQFLLCSKVDANLNLKIGLFSYEGGTDPLRTWTCTLPQEWKNNYKPIEADEDIGYQMFFEASTGKIWVCVNQTLYKTSKSQFNTYGWYFSKKITESGALNYYNPASEIPGWNDGNLKVLDIGRYARIIYEFQSESARNPDIFYSFYEYDPVAMQIKSEAIKTWTDSNSVARPINDFYTSDSILRGGFFLYGMSADNQKNFSAICYIHPTNGMEEQRFIRFKPTETKFEQPIPDPSANNVTFSDPKKVILKASAPILPSGYRAEGSRWEVYKSEVLLYSGSSSGTNNTHLVTVTLPDGAYTWKMAYDWVYSGTAETMRGATNWSPSANIAVQSESKQSTSSGSSGCNVNTGSIFLLVSIMFLRKKTRD